MKNIPISTNGGTLPYRRPELEVIIILTEQGFAVSDTPSYGFEGEAGKNPDENIGGEY